MSDGINAWRRLEQPYMNYLSQFVSQNPNFRPLQYYPESTVANLTSHVKQGLGAMWRAGNQAQQIGNNAYNFGGRQMQVGNPGAVAGSMNQAQNAANAAASGAIGAAGGLNSLNQNGLNQANFNSIANNPALQGQIDAVSQDIMRNTAENVIPGIATSAVGSGNPYSTRTQHSYDTALRQTRETIGDVAAQMRYENFSDARNQTLAQQQQNQAAEAQRRAMLQQGYLGGGQMQMGAHQFTAGMQNQMGQQGLQNQLAAQQMFQQGAGNKMNVGQYYQDYAQARLDDRVARHMFNQTSPFYTLPLYSNAMAPPAGMPFRIGQGGGMSSGPNLGFF